LKCNVTQYSCTGI